MRSPRPCASFSDAFIEDFLMNNDVTTAPAAGPIERRRLHAVLAIASAAFFLLFGYETVRSASVSMFINAYGAARLPYVMALSPVGVIVMIYGYGRLLTRLGAGRTLAVTSLLSGVVLAGCYVAVEMGSAPATALLYVLREGYIVLVIEQYWSFINSTLATSEARRLNGPVCGIASVGAVLGGLTVGRLAPIIGTEALVAVAAATLIPAAVMGSLAYRVAGPPRDETTTDRQAVLGLGLFRQHRTLGHVALLILLTQLFSTLLDLRFSTLTEVALPEKDTRTAFFGDFYAALNGTAFLLQFVVTPLVLRYVSLRQVHLAIPLLHMFAMGVVFFEPTLAVAAVAFLLFKSIDYSVFRATKEILYIPLPYDARYRAKEVIDAFGYRASKGVTSGAVSVVTMIGGAIPGFIYPVAGFATALGWWRTADRATREPMA